MAKTRKGMKSPSNLATCSSAKAGRICPGTSKDTSSHDTACEPVPGTSKLTSPKLGTSQMNRKPETRQRKGKLNIHVGMPPKPGTRNAGSCIPVDSKLCSNKKKCGKMQEIDLKSAGEPELQSSRKVTRGKRRNRKSSVSHTVKQAGSKKTNRAKNKNKPVKLPGKIEGVKGKPVMEGQLSEKERTCKQSSKITNSVLEDSNVKIEENCNKQRRAKKRIYKTTEGTSALGAKSGEPPKKRSRTLPAVSVTTRSLRSKTKCKFRFVFDKVCNCRELSHIIIFTEHGRMKTCPCGKVLEQFLRLTGSLEPKADPKIPDPDVNNFGKLSIEMICYIFQYLSVRELLRLEILSKKIQKAVLASVRVREVIDFNEDIDDERLFEQNLCHLTNYSFEKLLEKLPKLHLIYNFHPAKIYMNVTSKDGFLSGSRICDLILRCKTLEGIDISDLDLLECLVRNKDHPKILGKFENRSCPVTGLLVHPTVLKDNSRITHLHLVGCEVHHLPQLDDHLEHLYLRRVTFTDKQPFSDFSAVKLRTFVMSHCIGPVSALKYIPLLTALSDACRLERLELQRVPFLGGTVQHVCEDSWQSGGFRRLSSLTMGECKNALDADLGFLMIASAAHLEILRVQPSLTKDAVFSALSICNVVINPGFEELHLGWYDPSMMSELKNQLAEGMADSHDTQSSITDTGMHLVAQTFPVKSLSISRCPHLVNPIVWLGPAPNFFRNIRELVLEDCHSLKIEKFCAFLTFLPELRFLTLRDIFKQPPLGCSRVGLSAGHGLGISSAMISPQQGMIINPEVVNNNAHPVDNNDDDDDIHAGNNNHEAANVDNENIPVDGQLENEAANQNAEFGQLENEAANQNVEFENETASNEGVGSEFENDSPRYFLRSGSKSDALPLKKHADKRNSERLGRKQSFNGAKNSSQQQVSKNINTTRNADRAGGSSLNGRVDGETVSVSKRGKALVTKKGLVNKVKSSKRDISESDGMGKSREEVSKGKMSCTCHKDISDSSCQVTHADIRKAFSTDQRKTRRSAKKRRKEGKILKPGQFKQGVATSSSTAVSQCPVHRNRKRRPVLVDKCDSTNDPVWEEDHNVILTIIHGRLEYLKLDAVGLTELNLVCYNLHILSISGCQVLKDVHIKDAPLLEKVHVSQCRKVNEVRLLREIYKLPAFRSKLVSLRPLHYVNEDFLSSAVFGTDVHNCNFGTVMLFDYSEVPSLTNYNRLRMKSWMDLLNRMTREAVTDFGFQMFQDMDVPDKVIWQDEGRTSLGTKWTLHSDVPWLYALSRCDNMEEANMKSSEWTKAGVYCREAKGHFSFWDAYADIKTCIERLKPEHHGLYESNVLTYINMCDISGVPNEDALHLI